MRLTERKYERNGFNSFFQHVSENIYPDEYGNERYLSSLEKLTLLFLFPGAGEFMKRDFKSGGEVDLKVEDVRTPEGTLGMFGNFFKAIDYFTDAVAIGSIFLGPEFSFFIVPSRFALGVVENLTIKAVAGIANMINHSEIRHNPSPVFID